ncbi:Putative L,D-transpeptidase YkuD [Poriferisphaera corsica]|uniref:L,D-transpeptidase YkuD n=1 Tax=Poriferisphaera corsica TaxID=2528020 RepID=A0A517YU08_9BACT|nr:L,D-transpeptidase family protein [Poriferisphaera corsica]QDU33706.1 Putative L,D-transpeptidase YkuD [Poriferisphaera corsica]
MVLGSQTTRDGMSRRYMVSRKRKPSRWPWVLFVLVIGGVVTWLLLSGSGDNTTTSDLSESSQPSTGNNVMMPVSEVTPQPSLPSRNPSEMLPSAPQHGQFTLGGNTNTASTPPAINPNPRSAYEPEPTPIVDQEIRDINRGSTVSIPPASTRPRPEMYDQGMGLIAEGSYVEGRKLLSALLFEGRDLLSLADVADLRSTLDSVNQGLMFSDSIDPADTTLTWYKIKSGDVLSRIGRKFAVPYPFLEKLNNVKARTIQAGKLLKVINGPFHARVLKNDYMMDVYVLNADGSKIYIASYMVGMGENDSTPNGNWVIEPGRKATNPQWSNPRTGEYFSPNDPKNPIGEYWLALKGIDENTSKAQSYGIHGTIDPDSIGTQSSMGCIRLGNSDIKELFNMLYEGKSTVQIGP